MSQLKTHWQFQYQVLSLHFCPSDVVLSQRVELAKKSLQTLQNNGFGTWFSDLCTPPVSKSKYIYITTKCTGRSYLRATRKNGLVFKRSGKLCRRRASLERAFENRQDIGICSLRDHLPAFRLPCVDGRPYRFSSRHHGGKPDKASKRGQSHRIWIDPRILPIVRKVLSWDETLRMNRLFHSNWSSVARSHARDSQAMTD